jgi:hypothetical protein
MKFIATDTNNFESLTKREYAYVGKTGFAYSFTGAGVALGVRANKGGAPGRVYAMEFKRYKSAAEASKRIKMDRHCEKRNFDERIAEGVVWIG